MDVILYIEKGAAKNMNESVQEYIDQYPDEVKELYIRLRTIIHDSVSYEIEEKLWAKISNYYVGKSGSNYNIT